MTTAYCFKEDPRVLSLLTQVLWQDLDRLCIQSQKPHQNVRRKRVANSSAALLVATTHGWGFAPLHIWVHHQSSEGTSAEDEECGSVGLLFESNSLRAKLINCKLIATGHASSFARLLVVRSLGDSWKPDPTPRTRTPACFEEQPDADGLLNEDQLEHVCVCAGFQKSRILFQNNVWSRHSRWRPLKLKLHERSGSS